MRVAALYDIHGNLPALEAVLDEIAGIGVDRIVIGGDVLPGPMPNETMARLRALAVPVDAIHGNGELAVLAARAGRVSEPLPEAARQVIDWSAGELTATHATAIAAWPLTLTLDLPGLGRVLFCHATPRDCHEIFTVATSIDRLRPLFERVDAELVVCGHTHMPFDRTVGAVRVINAGSVGMPFGPAGADWLLLDTGAAPRHTMYDVDDAAERIRRTTYPGAAAFAEHHVRTPPAAARMLDVFAAAELRGDADAR